MVPVLAKVKLLRHWAGIVDITPDSSPNIGPSAVEGIYLNCGWGTGGFKTIPAEVIFLRIYSQRVNTMKSAARSIYSGLRQAT